MKPNYKAMNRQQLRKYVLQHRDDIEAIRQLFQIDKDRNVKRYPPVCDEEGRPIEENIRIMEQAIQKKIEQENHNNH